MDDFELTRSVTFGQYIPGASIVHRLDPRVKLVGAILLLFALLVATGLVGVSLTTLALLALSCRSGIPFSYTWKAIRAIWPFMLLVVGFQLFFFPGLTQADCQTLGQWHFIHVTTCSVRLALVSLVRFIALLLLIHLLTMTTSLNEVIHGTEHLLRPLARVGLPAHELALTLAITLRFVPLLIEETERIMKAQAARGADFGRGRWGFVQRAKRLLPLLIPLFVKSLDRAEILAVAMEARCYGGSKGRTQWIQLKSKAIDYVVLVTTLLFCALIVMI